MMMTSLTCLKIYTNIKKDNNKNNSSNHNGYIEKKKEEYWKSYKRETFEDDGTFVDDSNNSNYIIKLDEKNLTICTIEPDVCDTYQYQKEKDKYIVINGDEKFMNANLEIRDNIDEDKNKIIEIVKTYKDEEGGYSIFYFKKSENMD